MFLPIPLELKSADRRTNFAATNAALIVLNALAYLLGCQWPVGRGGGLLAIFLYGFCHGDSWHLLLNMWALWVFGNPVNRRLNNLPYLLVYYGCQLAVGLTAWLLVPGDAGRFWPRAPAGGERPHDGHRRGHGDGRLHRPRASSRKTGRCVGGSLLAGGPVVSGLSGRMPFAAESPTAMIFQHAYESPFPLEEAASGTPSPMVQIVQPLMAKDPNDRYADCAAVLADLHAYRQGRPLPPAAAASSAPAPKSSDAWDDPKRVEELIAPARPLGVRDWAATVFRRHARQCVQELQGTTQQMDGAVAHYERRRQRLATLYQEARELEPALLVPAATPLVTPTQTAVPAMGLDPADVRLNLHCESGAAAKVRLELRRPYPHVLQAWQADAPGTTTLNLAQLPTDQYDRIVSAEGYAKRRIDVKIANNRVQLPSPDVTLYRTRYAIIRYAINDEGSRDLSPKKAPSRRVAAAPRNSLPLFDTDWRISQDRDGLTIDRHRYSSNFGFAKAPTGAPFDSLLQAPDNDSYVSESHPATPGLLLFVRNEGWEPQHERYAKLEIEEITEHPPADIEVLESRE